jgi:hypothetical protein
MLIANCFNYIESFKLGHLSSLKVILNAEVIWTKMSKNRSNKVFI